MARRCPRRWIALLAAALVVCASGCEAVATYRPATGEWRPGPSDVTASRDQLDGTPREADAPDAAPREAGHPDGLFVPDGLKPVTIIRVAIADAQLEEETDQTDNSERFKVNSESSRRRWGLVRFDVATLPAGPVSAMLQLCAERDSTATAPVHQIHRVLSSWDETTVTWSTQPGYLNGASASFNAPTTVGQCVQVSVLADVQLWLSMKATSYGWLVISQGTDIPTVAYASRENPTAAWRPRLIVRYP